MPQLRFTFAVTKLELERRSKRWPPSWRRSNEARLKLLETLGFRRKAADRLNLDRKMVKRAVNALMEARIVPCSRSDNAEALAMDGAWLLMGIGSRVRPDAIARVTPRFASMTLQIDGESPRSPANAGAPSATFEDEMAALFRNTWKGQPTARCLPSRA
ncbi:hypothetical protein [Bradyrhizobium tunisiense]|uniref:hypothetical protein n=1 Tax=Bradyrhizobium tunisiense TaxID=3278709 RepID=UPI0035DBAAA5